ncbi:cyclin-dependent protein kinase [Spiromyces aspiralis]|uniref:Cyclin-dependent protein kinase n=1 Tax=Spiromyces aspiralis TaxID=68401 RepID=A0ACC1HLV7_9FUNG|nr:cyclin-dependent protein kinase [Spiromyces aspiralis]
MKWYPNNKGLQKWYQAASGHSKSVQGYKLLERMLDYNPETRITAKEALEHPYFSEDPIPVMHPFHEHSVMYPKRQLTLDELCDRKD